MPTDFVTVLEEIEAVSALIGDRIFPMLVPEHVWNDPQDRRGCIVYTSVSMQRGRTFCGTDELKAETFTLACSATTYDGAKALGDAVVDGCVDFTGNRGGTYFGGVFLENEFDVIEIEPGLFQRDIALTVWHRSA